MLEILHKSHAHKQRQETIPAEVRVTEAVWDYLKKTDHVIPGRVEKGAAFLRIGKQPIVRKRTERKRLNIDITTGKIRDMTPSQTPSKK